MNTKGTLVISIDYEFALGYADFDLTPKDFSRIQKEKEIVERLLKLFEMYAIPATWAIVSHLRETNCHFSDSLPHPEYSRPIDTNEKRDWFALHPQKGDRSDVCWFDVHNLIPRITSSNAGHEIASHSYAHILYGAPGVSRDAIEVDLQNMRRIHEREGLPFVSFVFPRSLEAHHDLLKKYGIEQFRGNITRWHTNLPSALKRIGSFLDYFLPTTYVVSVYKHKSGLIDVPESLLLLGRSGIRSLITPGIMKKKLKRNIHVAEKQKKIFHLWFHPSNFSYDTDTQFSIFESVLQCASEKRDKGNLDIKTMGDIAKTMQP